MHGLKAEGRRIAAYGAAAKGTTLLSYCGFGTDILGYVVDRNPFKHGRYMPGSKIEIRPVEQLLLDQPDDTLLLTWNFADEILEQQAEYRARGGRFIIPSSRATHRVKTCRPRPACRPAGEQHR